MCWDASASPRRRSRRLSRVHATRSKASCWGPREHGRDGSRSYCVIAPRMALRELLAHIADEEAALALRRQGGHAFVSASLRPYLIAALADLDEPARAQAHLIVAGDDRAARDLAADLGAWLAPRRVRYYPSRGVTYESHLRPPAHLVGLRMAALDALLADADGPQQPPQEAPVVVVSAVALSEKVPDPALRPRSFSLRVGDLLDLEECAQELVKLG